MNVTIEDLSVAAEWLDVNEGESGEMESCQRVRDWLNAEIDRRIRKSAVRKAVQEVAKKKGVSPALVRAVMKDARR